MLSQASRDQRRPSTALHVNRGACFFDDDDDARYLAHLGELAGKCECAVHAQVPRLTRQGRRVNRFDR